MNISGFLQFLIGFIIGIVLFGAGIAGGAYYFLTQISANPTDPSDPIPTTEESNASESSSETQSVAVEPEPKPEPEPTPTVEPEREALPDGAYRARVTWSTGLNLRAEPSENADSVGGVGFNSELIILSTSGDRNWQRVRVVGSGQEAWVKAGNVTRID